MGATVVTTPIAGVVELEVVPGEAKRGKTRIRGSLPCRSVWSDAAGCTNLRTGWPRRSGSRIVCSVHPGSGLRRRRRCTTARTVVSLRLAR